MERFARFFCDPVKVIKLIAVLALSIFLVLYVYFQVIGGFDDEIITETSMLVSLNDTIECDACIFRDETVIQKNGDGVVVTLVSEGERVSKGQAVANIYSNERDAVLQDDLNRVERRIEILEDSSVDKKFVISDLQKIYDDISDSIFSISKNSVSGDLSSAISNSEELLIGLNKRDMIVETEFDYTDEYDDLLVEKERLEERISEVAVPVIAENSSGYFYGDVDGYEHSFDISKVDLVSIENFDSFLSAKPDDSLIESSGGKIVNDIIWYVICSFDSEDKSMIKEGRYYSLSFPENGNFEIKMELQKIISDTSSANSLAVFRVNVLPGEFNYKRFQEAEIVIKRLEGITIPKKSLRTVNGVEGVFILVGDVVRFRTVERIDEIDDHYIVSLDTNSAVEIGNDDEEEKIIKPLSLYDNVIVSGKDLFDGKIIA